MFLTSQSVRYCKRRTGGGGSSSVWILILEGRNAFQRNPLYCGHKGREFLIVPLSVSSLSTATGLNTEGRLRDPAYWLRLTPMWGLSSRNLATFFILLSVIHEKRAIYLLKLLVECIYLQLTWNRWLLSAGWSPQRYVLFRLHVFSRSSANN